MERMNGLIAIGAMFVFAGLMGFAIPVFTTQSTETVAKIGDLKLQSTEDTSHRIPQILSGGVLALGLVLIGTGLSRKR
jgi:hypothetical protein